MPSWSEIHQEPRTIVGAHDQVRRRYLHRLHERTGRNVIVYYSGWLQKSHYEGPGGFDFGIGDYDKNGFMTAIHGLDRTRGLDLVLHTPGGGIAATESIVDYLRSMFGTDIRAIVPHLAMSAGTMIACACREILLGKQSSLGPIDPQLGGVLPAHGIVEEFESAIEEIRQAEDPDHERALIAAWQPIIANYSPTLIGEAKKAIEWADEMVRQWLQSGMFAGRTDASDLAQRIVTELGDHALTKSHDRHVSLQRAKEIGLNVVALEDDQDLQDAVLSVHHACNVTIEQTTAAKIIENHEGVAFIRRVSVEGITVRGE